jgi:hypothetical protein
MPGANDGRRGFEPLGTALSSLANIPAVVSPLMPALATLT